MLGQHLIFIGPFQGGRVILDEAGRLERVGHKLRVEWNVGKCVTISDAAYQLSPAKSKSRDEERHL